MKYKRSKGFSMFEVIVVLALLSIVMPSIFQIVTIVYRGIAFGQQKTVVLTQLLSESHILQKNIDHGIAPAMAASCTATVIFANEKRTDCTVYVSGESVYISSFEKHE